MNTEKDKSINLADLPENKIFTQKEHYQHPQPAGQGRPLDEEGRDPALKGKESNRTSKEEGLNQKTSGGVAGPFEGFEDNNIEKK
jgi:hypothetical protein